MFRLDANPSFWTTVAVRSPDGETELGSFRAEFRALTISELEGFDITTGAGARALLEAALAAIDEVEDDDGSPLALTPQSFARLADINHVRQALLTAFLGAIGGARRGN
ncbi:MULTISPECIES: hypothetical protein [Phyllobacteriaceae]|jgi:hypothetical protein|uniref:Uncharacterized protein n=1 Tax=Mesorhizobium hungaricum TaxID=1566387 RepID=A0A1C2DS41_9HYPH|nr:MULTISPECIES: hypothetical protein [Mesorhizobium]MBN9236071.1 hypothetical protein [Mesorhizobium sp.]MDQ0328031.1 hypothetical protein [Mesorhizobium sp. YL-MeA3-2017]OCX17569.1 hypothetical protein QV13_12485 [Mesorhizobium hungaricum]